jgi:hypothetical protein
MLPASSAQGDGSEALVELQDDERLQKGRHTHSGATLSSSRVRELQSV